MINKNSETSEKINIYLLVIGALVLGVAFDYLFFDQYLGFSVVIFEAIAILIAFWFGRRFNKTFRPAFWLLALALFFVAMIGVRDNMFLAFLNIVASMGLLLLATQELHNKKIINFRLSDYLITIITTPFKILRRFLKTIFFLSQPSQNSSSVVIKRVVIGIIMALPFLIIFGTLFASADLAFKQLVDSIFRFQISEEFFSHLFVIVVISVISLGVLAYLFNVPGNVKQAEALIDPNQQKRIIDRNIEIKVFLWMIAGLFAIFLVFQIAYLFGGVINITQGDFTYAEYARKGFWELLTVAFFTLVMLLIVDTYSKSKESRFGWFTLPSLVLILEIFVIIISAFKRLMLYQDAYGLTTERLYASGFIILLAVIFIILGIKLWREKEERFFAFASFLSMIAFLICMNILNPDAFIVRKNIEHFNQTGKIDAGYLVTMSADAVPSIISVYERLKDEDKAVVGEFLNNKKRELVGPELGWQSYNLSRQKALTELNKGF